MNPREFHPYGYDNQRSGWSDQIAPSGVEFMPTEYTYENSNHYYPNPSHGIGDVNRIANTSEPYFRSMAPGTYTHVNRDQRYSMSQDFAPAPPLIPEVYQQLQQYSPQCLPMSSQSGLHLDNTAQQTRFIPTPSQIAHAYSTYPQQTAAHTIQEDLYDPSSFNYPAAAVNQMAFPSNDLHPQPSRIVTTGRPRGGSAANSTSPTSSTPPSGERFPCEKCGKTFSRSHDRKRHYETQHLPSPIVHRCVYCRKEFSRADSLKRHLDNGCDEMHS